MPTDPSHPFLLWVGILGGPLAYALVRLAGALVVTGSCSGASNGAGLSAQVVIMAIITVLCALVAAASGLLSWRNWTKTARGEERQTGESTRTAPFWSMAGMFLSSVFLVYIVLTGALALGLGAACAS